jgi:hypothetical protein
VSRAQLGAEGGGRVDIYKSLSLINIYSILFVDQSVTIYPRYIMVLMISNTAKHFRSNQAVIHIEFIYTA